MGRHLKINRKKYKKERKRRKKDRLYKEEESKNNAEISPSVDEGTAGDDDKGTCNSLPLYHDVLYTSLVRYMKCKQRYAKMKCMFNSVHDVLMLDPDRYRRQVDVH